MSILHDGIERPGKNDAHARPQTGDGLHGAAPDFKGLQSVFGNFSFYSYKKACGQKKTVRGS
ncbi:hypothetical protein, partial [uncultured Desulfovibrio sp.]|uniref:hypothetical protein n=1 Tax=uncultured Desulfovibrio sp. TaxID=167968 RepID=UPI002605DB4C